MGRKKGYDRDALLDRATAVFRAHGFAGTSAEMLVQHLGVNRYSLYAEFGSKQGLFEAALERYEERVLDHSFAPLESEAAGVAEIRALLASYGASARGPASGLGCLLCNTAVEFGSDDPTNSRMIQRYFERLSNAFQSALDSATSRGELRSTVDARAEAAFFTAAVLGMFVMVRAEAPAELVERAAGVAMAHVDALAAG